MLVECPVACLRRAEVRADFVREKWDLAHISGSGALYGELLPVVTAAGHGGWPVAMRVN